MWVYADEKRPPEQIPVIIAYVGFDDDLEYAIAEYMEEDFTIPRWRVYINSDSATATIDIHNEDVILWNDFEFPFLSRKEISEFDLKGAHINQIRGNE